MQVSNAQIQSLLNNLPDPKMRREMSDILTGQVKYEILCLSEDVYQDVEEPVLNKKGEQVLDKKGLVKTETINKLVSEGCKGRSIGKIYNTGKVVMTTSDGKAWLRSSRDRFDGHKGFQCWCGNDSLLAKQELGHIGEAAPSKEDLGEIWKKISSDPNSYPTIKGETIIDGFMLKEII